LRFRLPQIFKKRAISLMSLTGRTPRLIDVDFFPHGFAIDPSHPTRVASFQKIWPGAALVDLASGQVLAKMPKRGEQQFYGHGAFTFDGSRAYIDLKSQKLLEKLSIPNRRFNAGHLQPLAKRNIIAVSAPAKGLGEQELGGISFRLSKASWSSVDSPQELTSKMTGEALSVAVSQKLGVFGVTHPSANLITFWSLADGKALASLSMPRPRGIEISADGLRFLLSYGQHAALAVVDAKTLTVLEQASETAYFSGSHIVNWSRITQSQSSSERL
jgi:hypothetical protein